MKEWILLIVVATALGNIYALHPQSIVDTFSRKYGEDQTIPNSLANFGNPPYGTAMVGRLFYGKLEDEQLACGDLEPINFHEDEEDDSSHTPILLVNRGSCPFSQKVMHAQKIGAKAVIVVDDHRENVNKVIMGDDGSAGNIFIPSYLISKRDGKILENQLLDEPTEIVQIKLTFDIPESENVVNYEIWMSSFNPHIRTFLKDFSNVAKSFGNGETVFQPHYVLWYCPTCREDNYQKSKKDCLSRGRYCAPDPDRHGGLTGKNIVMEDLRQICIYEQTLSKKNQNLWWDYIKHFYNKCRSEDFIDDKCSKSAAKKAGVDWNKVKKCVSESFEERDNLESDNVLLRTEKSEWLDSNIAFFPALKINGAIYRGDIEPDAVLQGICAGFKDMPSKCLELKEHLDQVIRGGLTPGQIVLIILSVGSVLLVTLYMYRRYVKRELKDEMRSQIDSAVSQYFQLASDPNVSSRSVNAQYT